MSRPGHTILDRRDEAHFTCLDFLQFCQIAEGEPLLLADQRAFRAGTGNFGTKNNGQGLGHSISRLGFSSFSPIYLRLVQSPASIVVHFRRPSSAIRCHWSTAETEQQEDDKEDKEDKEAALYGSCHTHHLSRGSTPISLSTGISSLHKSSSTSSLHGCALHSPIFLKYLSTILSHCRIFTYTTLSHVKHATNVNKPSWLFRTGRLTVKGCRSKTLELWLSWLVCPLEVRA